MSVNVKRNKLIGLVLFAASLLILSVYFIIPSVDGYFDESVKEIANKTCGEGKVKKVSSDGFECI